MMMACLTANLPFKLNYPFSSKDKREEGRKRERERERERESS